MKTRVYVAGPYTKGDVALNVRAAMLAADKLMNMGYAPYCPHLIHFMHLLSPREYENWMALDFEWLLASHIVLRLPGESSGADREVTLARSAGIPVCTTFEAILIYPKER